MITRIFRIYGVEGHRQRESFRPSYRHDLSCGRVTRIIEVENADITGTNEFTVVKITRNSYDECYQELLGQLTDGIFENSRTGRFEEIDEKGATI